MAQFGTLIKDKLLLQFHNSDGASQSQVISEALTGSDCKVIAIDVLKNQELCMALRINTTPHYMLYNKGQLIARFDNTVKFEEIFNALEVIL